MATPAAPSLGMARSGTLFSFRLQPSSSRKRAKGASVYLCSSREAIPGIQRIVENALLLNLRKLSQRRHQRFAKGIALNFSREIPC